MADTNTNTSNNAPKSPDQGNLPPRDRTNVSEAPEMGRERGAAPDNDKPSQAEGDVDVEDEDGPLRGPDVRLNVTSNPVDVVAGGGSTPLGAHAQDSRTWTNDAGEGHDQKGGSRSNRAAHSGATGERSTSRGPNKPEPKDQDEKGMAHPRNR